MNTSRAAAILLAKELRLEFRTREILTATVVFSLVVIMLFSYVIRANGGRIPPLWPGVAVDRLSVCRIADAAPFLCARAIERHTRRAAHDADIAFRDSSGKAAGEFRLSLRHRSWCLCRSLPCSITCRSRESSGG